MLSDKMQAAMNDQLNAELYSAYLYYSMTAYFQSLNLPGFTNWMRCQTQEELLHASKYFDHLDERNGRALLKPIDGPPTEWDSPLAVVQHTLEHEQMVTDRINSLVDLAIEEKDHASNNFLQWFVAEQVEEESSVGDVLQKLKLIKDSAEALLLLDRELAQRVFVMPPAPGEAGA